MVISEIMRDPGGEFSPVPFLFLNGDLRHKEIKRQLRDFKDHGIDAVVLHPRMGLPKRIGYLSKEFFSYIRTAVTTCRELDMRVVFYDEGMYPSGSACGQVVKGHPELESQGLLLTSATEPGDEVLAHTDAGILAVRHTGGTIRGVHYGEDDREENAPKSADILNPEAVSRFIALTHEAYYREFHEYFGNTVMGFFTDEPNMLGRCVENMGFMPWTRGFADIFKSAGGKIEDLTALFEKRENEATRLYWELIIKRENDVYYASLSEWCEKHGIALMGHPDRSDDIERERHFHIPGQDLVYRQVSPEVGDLIGPDSAQGKCSADAARILGRRRNSNECLGVCGGEENPWSMTAGDIKWFIDYLAVRGVNMYILHAFYYSVVGARKDERPPDVGPHSIWWPRYRMWTDYIKRVSYLMTDAKLHAKVAVLCKNRALMPERVAPLFENQIGFQYIPESFWGQCREERGRLYCEDMAFDALIGPEDMFTGVSRDAGAVEPDIVCERPEPELRCIRFEKLGRECRLLVNAGEADIETAVILPAGHYGQYDPWTNEEYRFEGELRLPRRGSLLIFACSEEEFESLPARVEREMIPAPEFELIGTDNREAKKVYRATIGRTRGILEVRAEEMAELTVNGADAGASFWGPHRFDLAGLAEKEENELVLTVTGSRANIYGKPVKYGILK